MSRTDELREAAVTQAEDLLDALHDLEEHVDAHPGSDGEDKHLSIRHARDRADRAKRTLVEDWPE